MKSFILKTWPLLAALCLYCGHVQAQLSGTITVPNATYADLNAIVTALNTQGVGSGGLIINLSASNPQYAPAGGYQLGSTTLNASLSSGSGITINGNGNTITAPVGMTTATDGVFFIKGADYVTINSLHLLDTNTVSATTEMEWGYALVKAASTAPFDGCQNVKIQNCSISLNRLNTASVGIYLGNHIATSTTSLTLTASADANSYNTFSGNTIGNVFSGITASGYSTSTYYDQNNTISGNTIQNFAGSAATAYGIYLIYQNNALIFGNTVNNMAGGGVAGASTLYGIYHSTGSGSSATIRQNNVNLTQGSVTSSFYLIYCAAGSGTATVNIDTNTISATAQGSSAVLYGIYMSGGPQYLNFNANQITGINSASTGTHYLTYFSGTVQANGAYNINNNKILNYTRTAASGSTYGFYIFGSTPSTTPYSFTGNKVANVSYSSSSSGSFYSIYDYNGTSPYPVKTMASDTVTNVSIGTGTFYGMYTYNHGAGTVNSTINNCVISNITSSGSFYGYYLSSTSFTGLDFYGNTINSITNNATASVTYGLYLSGGTLVNIYKNNFYNLQSGITTSSAIYGMYINAGSAVNVYNNFISDIRTPAGSSTSPIYGMYFNGGTAMSVYHNTIYLNPVSSGTNFGATGVYYTSSVGAFDLRNNIVYVSATPAGTGFVAAVRRSDGVTGTAPANFAATSGGNIYYAPNVTNSYLYAEGVSNTLINGYNLTNDPNFNTSCGLFKSFVAHDYNSFTESNLTAGSLPYTFVPTGSSFAESNGQAAGIPTDYSGATRPAAPDAGALQFAGTAAGDVVPPAISFSALAPLTYCTTPPTLSAIITDASGINTTAGTKPRMYYRKSTEADAFGTYPAGNASTFNGWKYVEATNSATPFSFTPDYAKLTSPAAAGDTILYFIVAQDNAATPNIGMNMVGLASGYCPASVTLTAAAGPTATLPTKKSYVILAQPAVPTVSPATATACQGTGVQLTGSTVSISGNATFGTSTAVNTTTGYPAPYTIYYGGAKHQMMIRSSELLAAGLVAGSQIQSLSFTVTAVGSAAPSCQNFQVSMGHTTATSLSSSSFIAGLTQVLNAVTYTPVVGVNTHTLSTPFTWNGTDNIVVETDFSNNVTGTTTISVQMTQSDPGFVSTNWYRADGVAIATVLAATTPTSSGNARPNMVLGYTAPLNLNWTPVAGLYKDAALTQALAATDTNKVVYAAPASTTSYTAVNVFTGCVSGSSAPAVVTVNPLPPVTTTPSGSGAICGGGSLTLSAASGYTYQWYLAGAPISGATAGTYNATNPGSYTVQVTNPATGCTATSAPINVTASPLPTASATAAGATTFCSGGSVLLQANTGTGLTYQWKQNGVTIPGAVSDTFTAAATGSYTVTVSNASGCYATSAAIGVTVNSVPAAITPSGTTTFCSGGSVVLAAPVNAAFTYQWLNNGVPMTGETAATYMAASSGSYAVTVTDINTGCSATSAPESVTVGAAPSSAITPAGNAGVCLGSSLTLATNPSAGLAYQWYLNGSPISGATGATYTTTAAGTFTVSVASGPNCSSLTATPTVLTVNSLPTATATASGSTTVCSPSSVTLNAGAGAGYTYQWNLAGVAISGATNATYAAGASGIYSVTTTSAAGCTATSAAVAVTVNGLPVAAITPAGPTTFCQGNAVVLNANAGTGLTYQWKLNGANVSGATAASYQATTSGNYTLDVTNTSGCTATAAPVSVLVNSLPAAQITTSGSGSICAGTSVVLNAPGGTGLSYQWQLGGANITGATGATLTASSAGSYSVTVTATATGCTAVSAPSVITVNALPTATTNPAAAATSCDSLVLSANTGTGFSYQWKNNGLPVGSSAAYTAQTSGSYTVTVTNAAGCSATSAAIPVTINQSPVPDITYSSPLQFCSGGAVVLNTYLAAGQNYQWFFNGTPVAGASTYYHIASDSGNYSVLVSSNAGCSKMSQPVVVQVNPLPTPLISYANGQLSTGSYMTYQWYFNNQPLAGAASATYTPVLNGAYAVAVKDANGCSNMSPVYFVNALGVGPVGITGTSIRVYPNPSNGLVHVDAAVNVRLTVKDINGKTVLTGGLAQEIDLKDLSDGMYLLFITSQDGQLIKTEKITKSSF